MLQDSGHTKQGHTFPEPPLEPCLTPIWNHLICSFCSISDHRPALAPSKDSCEAVHLMVGSEEGDEGKNVFLPDAASHFIINILFPCTCVVQIPWSFQFAGNSQGRGDVYTRTLNLISQVGKLRLGEGWIHTGS